MTITNEHLSDIEGAFDTNVLNEIAEQYRANETTPSKKVCAALARVYGKTVDEIEVILSSSSA